MNRLETILKQIQELAAEAEQLVREQQSGGPVRTADDPPPPTDGPGGNG